MKKFVAAGIAILFLGLIGLGVYGWKNPGTRAKLEGLLAALYSRTATHRDSQMSLTGLQVPNDGPVPPGTSINAESVKAIRSLLLERNFEKLNSLLENYENTLVDKDDLLDVYNAFTFSDPKTESILIEWVNKFPGEYRPYLARGTYYVNMGYVCRGTKYAEDTTTEQFENMESIFPSPDRTSTRLCG